MQRTKLSERVLPSYTKGEEIFNMVSHIVGGALGLSFLVLCVVFSAIGGDPYSLAGSIVYGVSVVLLYTMSSIYHGLWPGSSKKVFQILDHCTIFILIAGTYTPIALAAIRRVNPAVGWVLFGVVWGVSALGITFNAIDLKKYKRFSMICYIVLGWCVVLTIRPLIEAITWHGFAYLASGGIAYTVGAILYVIGGKGDHRYMHSVFHLFVVAASILHFICIFFYVIRW